MKLTAVDASITHMYEMLNVCNRAPNPKQKTPKRLFIATEPNDDLAKFRVSGEVHPAALADRMMPGLFKGTTCVGTGYRQNDGEWAFYAAPSANVETYTIRFGVDANGDGTLQLSECGATTGFSVTAFNSAEYNAQRSALSTNANLARTPYPVGATLLLMFLNQSSSLPDPPDSISAIDPVNCFTLGSLTHNVGETFDEDGSGIISRHLWEEGTKAAKRVAESAEIQDLVNGLLASYTNEVANFFAAQTHALTYEFSFTHENALVNFSETSSVWHPIEYDLHIAFGRAVVESLSVSCVFEKLPGRAITLRSLSLQGILKDLYDFNFEDGGLAQQAAKLQLGWRTDSAWRTSGRIFGEKVVFQAEFDDWSFEF